jgi:hypothetical protein
MCACLCRGRIAAAVWCAGLARPARLPTSLPPHLLLPPQLPPALLTSLNIQLLVELERTPNPVAFGAPPRALSALPATQRPSAPAHLNLPSRRHLTPPLPTRPPAGGDPMLFLKPFGTADRNIPTVDMLLNDVYQYADYASFTLKQNFHYVAQRWAAGGRAAGQRLCRAAGLLLWGLRLRLRLRGLLQQAAAVARSTSAAAPGAGSSALSSAA